MKQVAVAVALILFLGFIAERAGAADVELNGTTNVSGSVTAASFVGDGSALINLNPTQISAGTANINISGNAATATTATSVANGVVSTSGLANGAVTSAKISFNSRIAIVASSGGDYADPYQAISNYSTWCPSLSATNPCLLKILPGVYNIGSNRMNMQPFIDIEGSGENITIIQGSGTSGVLYGASNAELRLLTIENTGGGTYTIGIYTVGASPSISHVTVNAYGGTYNMGINTTASSKPVVSNSKVYATGTTSNYAIYNDNSSPILRNTVFSATGGSANYGMRNYQTGTVIAEYCTITGTTTIFTDATVATKIANSKLDGGAIVGSGVICAGVFDENYSFYASTCP